MGRIICANTDDTQRIVIARQLGLLRDLAAGTTDLRRWRDVCDRGAQTEIVEGLPHHLRSDKVRLDV